MRYALSPCVYAFIMVSTLLMLSSCASLDAFSNNKVPIVTYRLNPSLPEQQKIDKQGPIISILEPRVDAVFDTPRIAYSDKPYVIAYYAYNEWAAAPGPLLAPLIRQTLERSGYFSAVLPSSSRYLAKLALDTGVVKLLHYYEGDGSYAHIVLNVQLIDVTSKKLISARTFEERVVAKSNDPKGGVEALNKATEKVLTKLTQFLIEQSNVGTM